MVPRLHVHVPVSSGSTSSESHARKHKLTSVDRSIPDQSMKLHSSPTSLHKKTHRRWCSYVSAVFLLVFVAVLYGEDFSSSSKRHPQEPAPREQPQRQQQIPAFEEEKIQDVKLPFAVGQMAKDCGVFDGKWIYDKASRPQYDETECPYIQPQLTCQQHGRPDRGYQHMRWQPHRCSLPSFNATFMLEKLRGKRMLFVGDSLNRGQFVSMVCLLHRSIPESSKSMETFDSLTVFTAKDYNATIEFYWAPFLVESNSDNAVIHRITDRIVQSGSIMKHGKYWEGADILVFNSYLWWMTGEKMKILKGSFSDEVKDITEMETEDAFRMALKSMTKWVEKHTDPSKNRIFFTSMSPSHPNSTEWGGEPGGNCYNQTTPIEDPNYWGSSSRAIMQVLGEELRKAKVPIQLLNITQLSEYRKDAHTQIYKKQWNPLTPEQIANPKSYADCIHWCLPGLQDTWNELLYAKLFFP